MTNDGLDLTVLLNRGSAGDRDAAEAALEQVYGRLKLMAGAVGGRGSVDDTLQPTALVHEMYARLFAGAAGSWNDRNHFFSVAAKAMRRIIVDNARKSLAQKRGGGWSRVAGIDLVPSREQDPIQMIMLDDALLELAELHPRQARIVELRFFAGLSVSEVASIIGMSPRTVELDWRTARAWLCSRLESEES